MVNTHEKIGLSKQARQHREMRQTVLRQHPEARCLTGPQHLTALAAPLLLAIHWSIAALVSGSNLLVVFITAFFAGQLVMHATGALVHETAHKLVFRQRLPKLLFDLNLELILGSFSKQLTYQHEHVSSHHPYMGIYDRDYEHEDICGYLARQKYTQQHPQCQRLVTIATLLVHALPFGFLLADEIFPRFYRYVMRQEVTDKKRDIGATHPSRFDQSLFIAVSLLANIILFMAFGFLGWLYHNWSLSLFLGKCGISNLGQSLSEHDGSNSEIPTFSTYWWGNKILFNTGYHNEHHTFPNVPWTRLPLLTRMSPEIFHAARKKSYFQFWWEHVKNDFSPSRYNDMMQADLSERCPEIQAGQ